MFLSSFLPFDRVAPRVVETHEPDSGSRSVELRDLGHYVSMADDQTVCQLGLALVHG